MERRDTHPHQEKFNYDLLENESLRSRFVGIVILIIFVIFTVFMLFDSDLFLKNFTNRFYWYGGIFLLAFMAIRAFLVSRVVRTIYRKKRSFLPSFLYFNVFIEVSIPSAIILLFSFQENPYLSLISPLTQIYFVMIVLTIMEMNMRISTFAGILSGLEFFLISVYFNSRNAPPSEFELIGSNLYYFGRSMLMVATGVIAGFLAERIKKNSIKYYSQQEEKRKMETIFGQQLSPQIAARLLESAALDQPEKHMACIMFLDVRDFTPATETMTPEEIIDYQNHIFPGMFRIINDHRGIVNQVMGDGLMATFGAPIPLENCCQEAMYCGEALLAHLQTINNNNGYPATRIGIGLHFGEVVTGNIGTEERRQFSITGKTVIVASRIEQLNKICNTRLLLSENVYGELKANSFPIKEFGKHQVKGINEPINIYGMA